MAEEKLINNQWKTCKYAKMGYIESQELGVHREIAKYPSCEIADNHKIIGKVRCFIEVCTDYKERK